jgi:calcineurin-like phosphoesterase family protein
MGETLLAAGCEIFFTSDLHLGHDKDFIYGPRGFTTVNDHDEAVIKNWNKTVGPDDIVFVLGDIIMGDDRAGGIAKLARLNGRIVICRGNHDTNSKMRDYWNHCPNIDQRLMGHETYANIIKVGKWSFYVSHRPTIMHDAEFIKPKHKEFCLHGHTHSKDRFQFIQYCCYNVALDAHDNCPVNVKTIQKDLIDKMQEMRSLREQNVYNLE